MRTRRLCWCWARSRLEHHRSHRHWIPYLTNSFEVRAQRLRQSPEMWRWASSHGIVLNTFVNGRGNGANIPIYRPTNHCILACRSWKLEQMSVSHSSECHDYSWGLAVGVLTDLVGIPPEDPGPAFGHRRSSLRQRHGLPLLKKSLITQESVSVFWTRIVGVRVVELITHVNDRIAQERSFHFHAKSQVVIFSICMYVHVRTIRFAERFSLYFHRAFLFELPSTVFTTWYLVCWPVSIYKKNSLISKKQYLTFVDFLSYKII